jgi:hypothetical protein
MASFFISYSRKDAAKIAENLRNHIVRLDSSHDIFLDVESIKAGADWKAELRRRIHACDFFIYIHSRKALESSYVTEELKWVRESELKTGIRKLMVYRIGFAAMVPEISSYQVLDQTKNFAVDFYKLMTGIFSGNSFFSVEHELTLEDEYCYEGKLWIEAPRDFLDKIQMVEYRFDYGWIDYAPIKYVKSSKKNRNTRKKAIARKFAVTFDTTYHFTLFVMIYLWNTKELAFVKKIQINH